MDAENRDHQHTDNTNNHTRFLQTKTRLENRLLARQLTRKYQWCEWLKSNGSSSLIALVTLVGILFSASHWSTEQSKNRQVRTEERLDQALSMAADENPNRRLAGISSLTSFLTQTDDKTNSQALVALCGRLAVEDSAPVRNALVSSIADLDSKVIN